MARLLQGRASGLRTGAATHRPRLMALVTKCDAGGPSSRKDGQFSNEKRRRGRPAHLRSPYDTPLRDGNRDRLMGLLTTRAAKTLMCYLMETNVSVYHWLATHYKANPIPLEGNWDEVSGEVFLRTLLSMPTSTAKYDLGRDSLFDNIASCEVDPRSMAQRIMEIRSQLAEEFVQELKQVAEENSLLLRETLQASLANMLSLDDPSTSAPGSSAEGGVGGLAPGGAAANVHPEMLPSVPTHPEMQGYGSGDEDLASSSKWKWPPPGAGIGQPGLPAKKKKEDKPPPPQNYDHSNWRTIVSLDLAVSGPGADGVQHSSTPLYRDSAKVGGPPLPVPPPKIKLPGLFEDDEDEEQQLQPTGQVQDAGVGSVAAEALSAEAMRAAEAEKLSGLEKLQQRFAAELEASQKDRPSVQMPSASAGSAIDNLAKAVENGAAKAFTTPAPAAPEVAKAPKIAEAPQQSKAPVVAETTKVEAAPELPTTLGSSPDIPAATDSSNSSSSEAPQPIVSEQQPQQQQPVLPLPDTAVNADEPAALEQQPQQQPLIVTSPIVARVGNDDAEAPADPSGQAFEWPLQPHLMADLPADIIEVISQVARHGGPLHPEIAELLPPSLRGVVLQQANKRTNQQDDDTGSR